MSLNGASLSASILFVPNLNKIIRLIEVDILHKDIYISFIDSWNHCDKVNYPNVVHSIISTYYCLMYMKLGIIRMKNYIILENSVIFISKLYKIDETRINEDYEHELLTDMVDFISNEILATLKSHQVRLIDVDGYLNKFLSNTHDWSNYTTMVNADILKDKCDIVYKYIDDNFLNCINIPKNGIFCLL